MYPVKKILKIAQTDRSKLLDINKIFPEISDKTIPSQKRYDDVFILEYHFLDKNKIEKIQQYNMIRNKKINELLSITSGNAVLLKNIIAKEKLIKVKTFAIRKLYR